ARILALGSFVANFSCQLYGMLTTPNMKQVADENHYAYSPNPFFIAAFFAMQTVLQLLWIKNLFVVSSAGPSPKYEHKPSQMAYVPIYALGNICIAAWMVFWISQKFWVSQAFVTVNTLVQLYAVFYLLGPSSPFALSGVNFLTHIVAKTFAGIGVLDFLDNGAVAMGYAGSPSTPVQILTVVLLSLLAASSDVLFGICIFYNALALLVGQ
ncbi:hypothetical protein SERLA73DRAFT_14565, partial [Serpula lacrymans var. lacrymans S7.3]